MMTANLDKVGLETAQLHICVQSIDHLVLVHLLHSLLLLCYPELHLLQMGSQLLPRVEISQIDHISPQRGHISNIPGLNESLTSINERPTTYLLYRHVACYLFFT